MQIRARQGVGEIRFKSRGKGSKAIAIKAALDDQPLNPALRLNGAKETRHALIWRNISAVPRTVFR